MSIKSDNENMAKLYTEGTMSASDKKKAAEVKKMYSADEPMGQAAGLKLKAAAKDLDRKYGKEWRKEEDAEDTPMPETREELREFIEDTIREYLEQQQKDNSDIHEY